jgi:hypothetical protein
MPKSVKRITASSPHTIRFMVYSVPLIGHILTIQMKMIRNSYLLDGIVYYMGPTKNRLSIPRVAKDPRGYAPKIYKPPRLKARFFETM